jgi:hypothetical protein
MEFSRFSSYVSLIFHPYFSFDWDSMDLIYEAHAVNAPLLKCYRIWEPPSDYISSDICDKTKFSDILKITVRNNHCFLFNSINKNIIWVVPPGMTVLSILELWLLPVINDHMCWDFDALQQTDLIPYIVASHSRLLFFQDPSRHDPERLALDRGSADLTLCCLKMLKEDLKEIAFRKQKMRLF